VSAQTKKQIKKMKAKLLSLFSSMGALIWGCIGGSCGIACFAGGCCGGTALLGFLSLSTTTMGVLQRLTPVFLGVTILSLGYAFYKAYKPRPAVCCADNNNPDSAGCCSKEKKQSFFKSKFFVWIITAVCAIMWVYPFVIQNESNAATDPTCCPTVIDSTKTSCCPQVEDSTAVLDFGQIEITSY
jgi:hypothetical protein